MEQKNSRNIAYFSPDSTFKRKKTLENANININISASKNFWLELDKSSNFSSKHLKYSPSESNYQPKVSEPLKKEPSFETSSNISKTNFETSVTHHVEQIKHEEKTTVKTVEVKEEPVKKKPLKIEIPATEQNILQTKTVIRSPTSFKNEQYSKSLPKTPPLSPRGNSVVTPKKKKKKIAALKERVNILEEEIQKFQNTILTQNLEILELQQNQNVFEQKIEKKFREIIVTEKMQKLNSKEENIENFKILEENSKLTPLIKTDTKDFFLENGQSLNSSLSQLIENFKPNKQYEIFKKEFFGQELYHFGVLDETTGPVIVSIISNSAKNLTNSGSRSITGLPTQLTGFIRKKGGNLQFVSNNAKAPSESKRLGLSDLMEYTPTDRKGSLKRAATRNVSASLRNKGKDLLRNFLMGNFPELEKLNFTRIEKEKNYLFSQELLEFDKSRMRKKLAIGVMNFFDNQNEDQMYANDITPDFQDFLEFLGDCVEIKGHEGYCAGMETDPEIEYGICTSWNKFEIMYHASPYLPKREDSQIIGRKRWIGNDIVVIIFKENGTLPFSPDIISSQYNQVYLVVQKKKYSNSKETFYQLEIASKINNENQNQTLRLPETPIFKKNAYFRNFLLLKVVSSYFSAFTSSTVFERLDITKAKSDLEALLSKYL